MACLANLKNGLGNIGGGAFSVMAFGDDSVKKLTTFTKLHNQINSILILISLLKAHNIRMFWQIPHYLNLSPHILYVYLRPQLRLRYLLTSERLPALTVHTPVRDAELAAAELLPEFVLVEDVAGGGVVDDVDGGANGDGLVQGRRRVGGASWGVAVFRGGGFGGVFGPPAGECFARRRYAASHGRQ